MSLCCHTYRPRGVCSPSRRLRSHRSREGSGVKALSCVYLSGTLTVLKYTVPRLASILTSHRTEAFHSPGNPGIHLVSAPSQRPFEMLKRNLDAHQRCACLFSPMSRIRLGAPRFTPNLRFLTQDATFGRSRRHKYAWQREKRDGKQERRFGYHLYMKSRCNGRGASTMRR